MSEHEYMAGGSSPVSGVCHLFEAETVESRDFPAGSLCGAVGSYGQFQPTGEVDGRLCENCQAVRERREAQEGEDE